MKPKHSETQPEEIWGKLVLIQNAVQTQTGGED